MDVISNDMLDSVRDFTEMMDGLMVYETEKNWYACQQKDEKDSGT